MTTPPPRSFALIALVLLLSLSGLTNAGEHPWKMSFADAAMPYTGSKYHKAGYVGTSGRATRKGLGCSGYTSAVLHRMRDGADWLETYNLRVHEKYGNEIARHFGLELTRKVHASTLLDKALTKALVKGRKLRSGLYLFNVRRGVNGHVGFVRVAKTVL